MCYCNASSVITTSSIDRARETAASFGRMPSPTAARSSARRRGLMISRKLSVEEAMYVASPGAKEASTWLEKKPTMQSTVDAALKQGTRTSSINGSVGKKYSGRTESSARIPLKALPAPVSAEAVQLSCTCDPASTGVAGSAYVCQLHHVRRRSLALFARQFTDRQVSVHKGFSRSDRDLRPSGTKHLRALFNVQVPLFPKGIYMPGLIFPHSPFRFSAASRERWLGGPQ